MIYLLSGDNTFEIEQRLRKIIAECRGEIERVDGSELAIDQLPDLLAGVTLFSSERCIVVKHASQNKPVWAALGEWLEKGIGNDVIFVERSPDKRTKTYKWLQKHAEVHDVKQLQPFEALRWLQDVSKGILGRNEAEFLVDYVGTDQWRLSAELDKLRLTGKPIDREVIRRIVEPTPQATSFELLDAAFHKNYDAFDELFDAVSQREDPYMFFGLLAGQVQAIAIVVASENENRRPEDAAKDVGLHPFVVRKVTLLARRLSVRQLRQLIERLSELDAHMKLRPTPPWTQIRSFLMAL